MYDTWALGGGGEEPSFTFGIDSSAKELELIVVRLISSMARLPGSPTPVATSSVKLAHHVARHRD